jgi:hypothetical protein
MDAVPAGVDPLLVEAYLAAEYVVHADPPLVLSVGRPCAGLDPLLAAAGVDCAAFVTAWNPRSRLTDESANRAAQARLEAELEAAGHPLVTGFGRDPRCRWPGEPSVLVPGLGREAALALGRRHDQHAVLWMRRGGAVELVWVGVVA